MSEAPDRRNPGQLFRREAIAASTAGHTPGVIRVQAPLMGATAALAGAILLALAALCLFGRVTQVVSAPGTLVPAKSSLKVFSPRPGVLVRDDVAQGQHVRKGDTLFVVSGEQYADDDSGMLARASRMIRAHIAQIRDGERLAKLQSEERARLLGDEIASSEREAELLDRSVAVAEDAVALDRRVIERKAGLRAAGAVAVTDIEKAQELLSADQGRDLALLDQRQALTRRLDGYRSDLAQLPIQLALSASAAEQGIAAAEVDLARNEMVREVAVKAPADGVIATAMAFPGEAVTRDQPLMVLDPEGSELVAQVLVPSRGIGFIAPGARAAIRYDAFPYQTFGYHEGRVVSVGDVALLPSEVQALKVSVDAREPVFNVVVALARQDVDVYGRATPLLAGSTFVANLSGETRPIWRWILNPLLSVKGNAFAGFGS